MAKRGEDTEREDESPKRKLNLSADDERKIRDEVANALKDQEKQEENLNKLYKERKKQLEELNRLKQVATSISRIEKDVEDDIIEYKKQVSREQKKYLENELSINSSLKTRGALQQRLRILENEEQQLLNNSSGKNAKQNAQKLEALRIMKSDVSLKMDAIDLQGRSIEQIEKESDVKQGVINLAKFELDTLKKKYELTKYVKAQADSLAESYGEVADEIAQGVKNIPLFGKLLGPVVDHFASSFKQTLSSAATQFSTTFTESIAGGMAPMAALKASAASIAGLMKVAFALAGPLLLLGVIYKGFAKMQELQKAGLDFKKNTGLTNIDADELGKRFASIAVSTQQIGVAIDDIQVAAETFRKEFVKVENVSDSIVKSSAILEKNFGVAVQHSAQAVTVFKALSGLSNEAAMKAVILASEMAHVAGLSADEIVSDIGKASTEGSDLYKYMKGNSQEITQAAIQARLMGSSLEGMADSAKALLDFEQGIENEISLIAMLGEDINLGRARELAARKDILGMEKELAYQLANIRDLSEIDPYTLEQMATTFNKSVKELEELQRIEKKFPDLQNERLQAAKNLYAQYGDIGQVTEEQLDAEAERIKYQEHLNSTTDQMMNKFSALGSQLATMLIPLGEGLLNVFEGLAFALEGPAFLFKLMYDFTSMISGAISDMIGPLGVVGKIMKTIAAIAVITAAYKTFAAVSGALAMTGVGGLIAPIIGGAAAAGILALGLGAISRVGDAIIPASGPIVTDPRVGTLVGDRRDDVVMGPGIAQQYTKANPVLDFLVKKSSMFKYATKFGKGGDMHYNENFLKAFEKIRAEKLLSAGKMGPVEPAMMGALNKNASKFGSGLSSLGNIAMALSYGSEFLDRTAVGKENVGKVATNIGLRATGSYYGGVGGAQLATALIANPLVAGGLAAMGPLGLLLGMGLIGGGALLGSIAGDKLGDATSHLLFSGLGMGAGDPLQDGTYSGFSKTDLAKIQAEGGSLQNFDAFMRGTGEKMFDRDAAEKIQPTSLVAPSIEKFVPKFLKPASMPNKKMGLLQQQMQQKEFEKLYQLMSQTQKNDNSNKTPYFVMDTYRVNAVLSSANSSNPITTRR